ncbi:MAG: restriction endonuclease subunit S [Oscillospiraceae bacterium]|nr:restriction endonuclease subunit S [Oscillospiraceae bacterium]
MPEYKTFRLGDLFGNATRGKRLKSLDRIDGNLPFVTAGERDTGISAFIGNNVEVFQANTITIDMFGSAKYRNYSYGADDHIAVVHTESIEKHAVIYVTAAIHKVSHNSLWDYSNNFYAKDADALAISLPIDNDGNPDYGYMGNYIRELELKRLHKLETYLKAKGLEQYRLTSDEERLLANWRNGEVMYKIFRLGGDDGLFDIETPKRRFNANTVKFGGKYRYVARGERNNGVRGYITESTEYLNPANTISFGQDTATIFFQDKPYFTGDKIKVFTLKKHPLNRGISNFLIACMRKAFSNSGWGKTSFSVKVLESVSIHLPIDSSGNPDYSYMTDFIRIQQKLAIKDLVEWKNREIDAYKAVLADK